MQSELDIINAMLAATGTAALTSSDTQHPYYIKADNKLGMVSREVQTQGWWFNRSVRTLRQNSDGEIILPSTLISVDPVDTASRLTQRGSKLFDLDRNTFNVGKTVEADMVELLPVTHLPPSALQYITARAIYEFYLDEDGQEPKLSSYRQIRDTAWIRFKGDHIKNADPNWFRSKSYQHTLRRYNSRRLPT